jgi:hypothetical protein
MRSSIFAGLTLTVVSLAFSCSDDHANDDHHPGGNTECQALGTYCHDPGQIDAAAQECHEVMHEAEDGCEERLEECRGICKAVIDGTGGAGSGGTGTGGSGHEGGNVECQELGEYCHAPGESDAAAQECHELMHEAEDGCEDRIDECRAICEAVIEASGGAGGGGAGVGGAG